MTKEQLAKKYAGMKLTPDFQQMLLADIESLDTYQQDYAEALEWLVIVFDALDGLVKLKRIKEEHGECETYLDNKDMGWYKAFLAVDSMHASKYFHDPYAYAFWKIFTSVPVHVIEDFRIDEISLMPDGKAELGISQIVYAESPLMKVIPAIRNLIAAEKARNQFIKRNNKQQ